MPKLNTQSVSFTIGGAVFLMVLLSVLTITVAVVTVYSSFDDAEAINVSGSLRMQSYRLAYDLKTQSDDLDQHIEKFESSLLSDSMQGLLNWRVPKTIQQDYQSLIERWSVLKTLIKNEDQAKYLSTVPEFVSRIDKFVFKLQQDSEHKLLNMVVFSAFGLTCIVLLSFIILRFVRLKIIYPLNALVHASRAVESKNFDVVLNESVNNEIGVVASAFNGMTQNIKHQYDRLETAVEEKTEKLHKANRSLRVLYESTQQLSASRLTPVHFQKIIDNLATVEHVHAVKLIIDDSAGQATELIAGTPTESEWIEKALVLDDVILGSLSVQVNRAFSDQEIVDNMTYILARGVYYNQAQKKFEQLLIYAERSAIARELHDSLAQSLSFLKIQTSLLKRSLKKEATFDSQSVSASIVTDIDEGLKGAYTQLRELLGTFRFSINEANFGEALNVLMDKLQTTTQAQILVDSSLSSIQLQASEQIHLLQIIREAVNNAIKHANSTEIRVECLQCDDEIKVSICDNGLGFDTNLEKADHYGLGIMNERSQYLNGRLTISSEPGKGACVHIVFTSKDESESE